MDVLTHAVPVPGQVPVDMLLGITSSLAKLDAKFDARFDAVEASIVELKTDVSGLKADVGALKVDVAVLKVDVSRLDGRLGTLETRVGAVEVDVRKLLDWKQRIWGMVLVATLIVTAAPSALRGLASLLFGSLQGASVP